MSTHSAKNRITCILNSQGGSAAAVREALASHEMVAVESVEPGLVGQTVRAAVASGAERVLVSGGDGTIAAAAAEIAGSNTALAVIPGGTLNHFARAHGIPTEPGAAATVAVAGRVTTTDVGYVNDRLILNTSSLGVYVVFVKERERLERRFGYLVASALAGFSAFARAQRFAVEIETDGQRAVHRTPLVFVGVGERELTAPGLGERRLNGRHGIHVIVVQRRPGMRLIAALVAALGGLDSLSRGRWLESRVVEHCIVRMGRSRVTVAVDGELERMEAPLDYRIAKGGLRVVVPAEIA